MPFTAAFFPLRMHPAPWSPWCKHGVKADLCPFCRGEMPSNPPPRK